MTVVFVTLAGMHVLFKLFIYLLSSYGRRIGPKALFSSYLLAQWAHVLHSNSFLVLIFFR